MSPGLWFRDSDHLFRKFGELSVGAFLNSRIAFTAIPAIVEETLLAAEARGLLREPDTIDGALLRVENALGC